MQVLQINTTITLEIGLTFLLNIFDLIWVYYNLYFDHHGSNALFPCVLKTCKKNNTILILRKFDSSHKQKNISSEIAVFLEPVEM